VLSLLDFYFVFLNVLIKSILDIWLCDNSELHFGLPTSSLMLIEKKSLELALHLFVYNTRICAWHLKSIQRGINKLLPTLKCCLEAGFFPLKLFQNFHIYLIFKVSIKERCFNIYQFVIKHLTSCTANLLLITTGEYLPEKYTPRNYRTIQQSRSIIAILLLLEFGFLHKVYFQL